MLPAGSPSRPKRYAVGSRTGSDDSSDATEELIARIDVHAACSVASTG